MAPRPAVGPSTVQADQPASLLTQRRKGRDEYLPKNLDFSSSSFFYLRLPPLTGGSICGDPSSPQNRFGMDIFVSFFLVYLFFLSFCVIQVSFLLSFKKNFFPNSVLSVVVAVCLLEGLQWGSLLQVDRGRKQHILWDYFFHFFFSNEWIHRRDTRLFEKWRGMDWWDRQHLLKCWKLPWKIKEISRKLVCQHCCSRMNHFKYQA